MDFNFETFKSWLAKSPIAMRQVLGLKSVLDNLVVGGGGVPPSRKVNGHALTSDVTVIAADVGLDQVDNTSDANKPVSTATQSALDAKVPTSRTVNGLALSGDIIVPIVINDGRLVRISDSILNWDGYTHWVWNGMSWLACVPSSAPGLANTDLDLDGNALAHDANYDIYDQYYSSTHADQVAKKWTSDTAQAVVPALWQGRLVYDLTADGKKRLFLGTVRLRNDGGTAKFTSSITQQFVSNLYNQRSVSLAAVMSGNSWAYNSSIFRKANGDDSTKIEFLLVTPQTVNIRGRHQTIGSNANTNAITSISVDSESTPTSPVFGAYSNWNATVNMAWAFAAPSLSIGYHYAYVLEQSESNIATCTFQSYTHGGIMAEIMG